MQDGERGVDPPIARVFAREKPEAPYEIGLKAFPQDRVLEAARLAWWPRWRRLRAAGSLVFRPRKACRRIRMSERAILNMVNCWFGKVTRDSEFVRRLSCQMDGKSCVRPGG